MIVWLVLIWMLFGLLGGICCIAVIGGLLFPSYRLRGAFSAPRLSEGH